MSPLRRRFALLIAVLMTFSLLPGAGAAETPSQATVLPTTPGSRTVLDNWEIQSSQAVPGDGDQVSKPDFPTDGWYPVAPRTTVLAGLVENGKYPDLFHSTNMRDNVDPADFQVPWWYRTEFSVSGPGEHTSVRIPGAISRADVWLNGTRIGEVVGTYNAREFDIGPLLSAGTNALAIRVHPADPDRDFVVSWIDWAQPPPDNNMGIWRDVELVRSGPVSVLGSYVDTKLAMPALNSADLVAKAEVRNNAATATTVTLNATIDKHRLSQTVDLAANETRTVAFPNLTIRDPDVWWPAQLGEQPLYQLDVTAQVAKRMSDRSTTTFGIRDVQAPLNSSGDRQFIVNGKPLQIRAGGWASDLLLRTQPERLEAQLRYVRDLGLNSIRLEGKLETPEFYDLANRMGIMLLAGWECCDKWEPWTDWGGEDWTPADYEIARGSMAAQARVLRSHPSVVSFMIGSDIAPPEDVQRMYLAELEGAGWPNPVLPAAASRNEPPPLGPSGMKMDGPYDWVPPDYWYYDQLGGAFGFGGELSAGHSVPSLDSVQAMLSPAEQEALWSSPSTPQYHTGRGTPPFNNLELFGTALAQRYGPPTELTDYVEKAQLSNYETTRAQFEGYARRMTAARPATGHVYWMLNNAWPSLNWHLYGHDLNPAGAYYGAKKANEALHVQYSYDDRSVVVVNQGAAEASGLAVRAEVYNLDGTLVHRADQADLSVPSLGLTPALTLPAPAGVSATYFVRLQLTDAAGKVTSRNTYWLSATPDVLDFDNSDWYYTPVSSYANLRGLADLPDAPIEVSTRKEKDGMAVTLHNTSTAIAPAVRVTLRRADDGTPVTPVTWTDNYVGLWPGESVTLHAEFRPDDAGGRPTVEVGGWNAVPAS